MLLNSEYDSGLPIGAVIQGFAPDPVQWQQLDGRTLTRSAWPNLSPRFPIGKYIGTVRTLAATPSAGGHVIATADYFVSTNAGGSSTSIQYSSTGESWSTTATASATPVALCAMAARIVALNGAAGQPIISATLVPSSAWTLMTGGPTSVALGNHFSRMAYSPTLGRLLVVYSTRFSVDDGSTAFTGRTSTSGLTTPVGTAWSGNRFVNIGANSAICEFSTDGISYTSGLLAEATSASQGNISSDVNGTLVVSGCPSGLQVSHDHGATWAIRQIPGVPASDAWRVQRAGDRFVVPTLQGLAFSLDGDNWFLETTTVQAGVVACGVAKKGGVTVQIQANTTAYSFGESATEFLLPNLRQHTPANSGNPIPLPGYFIKGA